MKTYNIHQCFTELIKGTIKRFWYEDDPSQSYFLSDNFIRRQYSFDKTASTVLWSKGYILEWLGENTVDYSEKFNVELTAPQQLELFDDT